ncbi:MAG: putative Zn-dependent peptidase [Phormidesmis priestleyi Ana]|uniref:Putative Zn-dependent peptidase n=1 Tax=Phormidesmis priestleyi Ana TaxID=1666911 RepID=A0A0P7YV75_9CYAN|nr:MAG: putative Zn-dependent peptidase [Phormidesmis priestleyi Ana]
MPTSTAASSAKPFRPSPARPASGALPAPVIRTLPNGLTIIAEQMPIEAVNLSLWLNMGSCVESDAINGMAHFLEHMIFKGTPQIDCGEFERLIEERGAVTNAATSQDYTHYYITTAPQDFKTLAPLQIELVLNSSLADDHFDRERPVILEEIRRAQDSPRRRLFYRSMEMCFDRLPYRRPVLGPTAVVEKLTAEQMRAFHRTWYQPQNMTAVAVGNLPVEELIQVVEEGFEQAMSRRDRSADHHTDRSALVNEKLNASFTPNLQIPSTLPEKPFAEVRRTELIDTALQQARLLISWRVPGMRQLEATYPLDVVTSVLSHGRSARLTADLRERQHLVNSISTRNMRFCAQGVFYISARVNVANLAEAKAAILAHIQQLHTEPITAEELRRVQTQVTNRYIFGSEKPSDRANLYGYYQAMTGDIRHALDYPERIRQVSIDDVSQAVRTYLPLDAYGMVVLKPDEAQPDLSSIAPVPAQVPSEVS